MLDISWLLILYQRASQHDNKFICRWAILELLSIDVRSSRLLSTCYWWFLYGPLMSMLNEYAIYARIDDDVRGDPPAVGSAVVTFFAEFATQLPANDRHSFCTGLLSSVVEQEFTQVPLLFMSQMLANLPSCPAWDSQALASIRNMFSLFRTFNPNMSIAIQSFLLKAVINLTDPRRVHWSDIAAFLSLLSVEDCLCRGDALWEATISWVWNIHNGVCEVGSDIHNLNPDKAAFSNLFHHLRKVVEVFLDDETLSSSEQEVQWLIRLLVAGCDAHLKFSKNAASEQPVRETFQHIVGVLQHASNHVYASESRTAKTARILSGILHHLNSTPTNQRSSQESDGVSMEEQKVDHSSDMMAELLWSGWSDILELLLRKLTSAPLNFTHAHRSFVFLDLASELYTFMTASIQSGGQGSKVYYHFIENLVQRSKETILKKQSDRLRLTLSDWRSFTLSMKCLALCCRALPRKPLSRPTLVTKNLCQAITELDLSSEFPTPKLLHPGEVGGQPSAVPSAILKSGWGRLVSDLLEAQWLCVEYALEESQRFGVLNDKLEPFLENLPEAALEALSLGSGLAVLPVIRCLRLLTPRMLLKDDALCSQALEAVWWTFQDRPKGEHIFFWRTLREVTQVFFNPCLLVLSKDHPAAAIVRKYWGELLAMGEDRPGIVNHVIEPCCKFWTGIPSGQNSTSQTLEINGEDRKQSLEVQLDFITEACVFGPREKKAIRVTNYVLEYVRRLGEQRVISPLNVDELRDDTRVRVNAVNTLMMLNPEKACELTLLQNTVRALITKNVELVEDKRRLSINSYSHRRKHRIWQAVIVALFRLLDVHAGEAFAREVLEGIFSAILGDNQVSVRNFLQWGMILIFEK